MQAVIGQPDRIGDEGYISDDVRRPEDCGVRPIMSEVENTILAFPSAIGGVKSAFVSELCIRETRLRRAKANDTLARVRESLSGLSFQYIKKVRQAKTTKDHLRAYKGITLLSKDVSFH